MSCGWCLAHGEGPGLEFDWSGWFMLVFCFDEILAGKPELNLLWSWNLKIKSHSVRQSTPSSYLRPAERNHHHKSQTPHAMPGLPGQ